ncbi:hypothetical protein H5410_014733 [Solanum commersonii]|uniref:Uncharacterized protein n=1 Tax=Solanum commersonii TaxID=4109 RepID=A0A9J5ZRP3_SOLCO|nr:hypothetical protein H5410_014733 [Solanum commersonii]
MVKHHRKWRVRIGQREATFAKACKHQLWRVRIWQMTSSNDIHHQAKPGRIIRGVCASAKRHRLWPACIGGINQGLDASDVACASANGAANGSNNQPMSARITPALHTLVSQRRAWPTRIFLGLHTTVLADVRRGLPTSPLACTQRSADVGHGLPLSAVASSQRPDSIARTHRSTNVKRGLASSSLAYTILSADVGRGLPLLSVARITSAPTSDAFPPSIVRILHTSVCQCRTWRGRVFRKLFTFVSRRRTWPANIVRSLHTSIDLPTSDVVCPYHLLLALVKRATSHAETLVEVLSTTCGCPCRRKIKRV